MTTEESVEAEDLHDDAAEPSPRFGLGGVVQPLSELLQQSRSRRPAAIRGLDVPNGLNELPLQPDGFADDAQSFGRIDSAILRPLQKIASVFAAGCRTVRVDPALPVMGGARKPDLAPAAA